jgi:hypothetical protein
VAGVEERGEGAVGGGHAAGRSWGRAWGTGAAVGQRGAAGTGPEPACAGERRTPVQNRGGRVAARGSPSQSRVAAVKSDLKSNSNHFKTYSNHSNFDRLKNGLPELKKIELKYGFEDIEKVNNFLHRSFSRFRMDFK